MKKNLYIIQWNWDRDEAVEVYNNKKEAMEALRKDESLYYLEKKHLKLIIKN